MAKGKEFSEQEVKQALNQLVEEGQLKLIVREDGEPMYVENTFNAGYNQALKDSGLVHPDKGN